MTSSDIDVPDDISDELAAHLQESTNQELREIIHYAQQLLTEQPSLTDELEARDDEEIVPRDGEEIVRMEDHGDYTLVVVERSDETGEAHGRFAYRVRLEPGFEGADDRYRWHYLGRMYGTDGGR